MPVTPSLEDYLEKIYFVNQRNGTVRVTDVAVEMNISKPSVNKAINILKTQGLVVHEHYGNLSLTEKGLKIAIDVANRHKLLKLFLIDLLGLDEDIAEEDACKLEHSMSQQTFEKLEQYLNKVFS